MVGKASELILQVDLWKDPQKKLRKDPHEKQHAHPRKMFVGGVYHEIPCHGANFQDLLEIVYCVGY